MLYENWLCPRLYRRAEDGPADRCPGGRGCERIYKETISGAAKSRSELERCLEELREDDTLVVWRLDRFGRSLKDIVSKMESLEE
jgi:DNA invertase Pin-like site-specific DNA recombinase